MKIKKSVGAIIFDVCNTLFMILMMAVMLYPFLFIISASISNPDLVARGQVLLLPKEITFEAYRRVLRDPDIWTGYANTIKYTLLQTVLTLVFTATTAYPLSKKRLLGRRTILMLIGFTMLFSGGLIPKFLVVQQLGMVNTTWAIVIPTLISTWYLFIMRTFFEGFPQDMEEAATIDGCGALAVLFRIVLPLSMPVFVTVGLYTAVGQWNSFFDALIYLNEKARYPLQIFLRNIVIANSAAAQAEVIDGSEMLILDTVKYSTIMVATLPILCVYPFLQKYFVQGTMIGGIKG